MVDTTGETLGQGRGGDIAGVVVRVASGEAGVGAEAKAWGGGSGEGRGLIPERKIETGRRRGGRRPGLVLGSGEGGNGTGR